MGYLETDSQDSNATIAYNADNMMMVEDPTAGASVGHLDLKNARAVPKATFVPGGYPSGTPASSVNARKVGWCTGEFRNHPVVEFSPEDI